MHLFLHLPLIPNAVTITGNEEISHGSSAYYLSWFKKDKNITCMMLKAS